MTAAPVGSREHWTQARLALLKQEKALTRLRDALAAQRRALPWVLVDKEYVFDTPSGRRTLGQLFADAGQLIVYHFMFHPDWNAGCKSCSFWADGFNAIGTHLAQRDTTIIAASRAPLSKLMAFKTRMGWSFDWVSTLGDDFNRDFGVAFAPEVLQGGAENYNFGTVRFRGEDAPGVSVFARDADGAIYHTYSCYSRGLDPLNAAYQYLDLTPQGRDESGLSHPMAWVRLRDEY